MYKIIIHVQEYIACLEESCGKVVGRYFNLL